MYHFGQRLRRLRGAKSQREIADNLDMAQTTLSSLENQESAPKGAVVKRLAEFFGVEVSYFYPQEPKVSDEARSWLEHLRTANHHADTLVAHSDEAVSKEVQERLKEAIRKKKHAKAEDR